MEGRKEGIEGRRMTGKGGEGTELKWDETCESSLPGTEPGLNI